MDSNSKKNMVEKLLEQYGINDQRTDAWHQKRGEMLTASDIYKALPEASPSQRHELIMSKLIPRVFGDGIGPRALVWGTRFEPIAKEIYMKSNPGVQIVDTTCVKHPTISFLGASPDGILITEDDCDPRYGKLVEFKCPISRSFSENTPVPVPYYHQMQLQMECTGMKECDYVEMKFRDLNYSAWVDTESDFKSWFAVHEDEKTIKYKSLADDRNLVTWKKEEITNPEEWNMIYWVLDAKRMLNISYQEDWLNTNLESIQSVWNQILKHRETGTLPEHPKEKTILTL